MNTKTFRFGSIKAGPDDDLAEGEMVAYASVFGNVDSYGDIVVKGAFKNTLKEWKSGGRTMPLLYGHNMTDPEMNIGSVVEFEEDDRGLKIKAVFDQDPKSQKVYRLVKSGRISELSFAFDTVTQKYLDPTDDSTPKGAYRELQEVKLYECSVVPIGANSETEVLAIKALTDNLVGEVKAGRTLSKANETIVRSVVEGLSASVDNLKSILPEDEDPEDDPDKSAGNGVTSESSSAGSKSSAADPTIGELSLEEIATKVAELLQAPPVSSDPPASDPLVTEIEDLALSQAITELSE